MPMKTTLNKARNLNAETYLQIEINQMKSSKNKQTKLKPLAIIKKISLVKKIYTYIEVSCISTQENIRKLSKILKIQ